jgi:hypothetical protein
MRLFIVSIIVAILPGCGTQMKMNEAPVAVSGKVSQGGRPVGNVVVVFHPLGDGHFRELPVHNDGSFSGELVSGEYAYYVAQPTVRGAVQPPRKLSPKYFEADMSRTVIVESGKQLAIALD